MLVLIIKSRQVSVVTELLLHTLLFSYK